MPRDLLQLYPTPGMELAVRPTKDNSRTRLALSVTRNSGSGATQELDVRDVQELAGALCQWLADSDHAVPAVYLESYHPATDQQQRVAERIVGEWWDTHGVVVRGSSPHPLDQLATTIAAALEQAAAEARADVVLPPVQR
jgi:hypothetical protein